MKYGLCWTSSVDTMQKCWMYVLARIGCLSFHPPSAFTEEQSRKGPPSSDQEAETLGNIMLQNGRLGPDTLIPLTDHATAMAVYDSAC